MGSEEEHKGKRPVMERLRAISTVELEEFKRGILQQRQRNLLASLAGDPSGSNAERSLFRDDLPPDGPWATEPDMVFYWDRRAALPVPCMIDRLSDGALMAWAGAPRSHPWFGRHPDEMTDVGVYNGVHTCGYLVDESAPRDWWWIGVAFRGPLDLVPIPDEKGALMDRLSAMLAGGTVAKRHYRTVEFAQRQNRDLVDRIREAAL